MSATTERGHSCPRQRTKGILVRETGAGGSDDRGDSDRGPQTADGFGPQTADGVLEDGQVRTMDRFGRWTGSDDGPWTMDDGGFGRRTTDHPEGRGKLPTEGVLGETIGAWAFLPSEQERGFWTTDHGRQKMFLTADGGPWGGSGRWAMDFTLAVILNPCYNPSPPAVIPETCGFNLNIIENASSARYPGSRDEWLLREGRIWTTEDFDRGPQTADGGCLDDGRWTMGGWTTDRFGLRTTNYPEVGVNSRLTTVRPGGGEGGAWGSGVGSLML